METLLRARVSKSFNHFELKSFDLVLNRGDVLGLVGVNGAGKTTLLNLLVDRIKPSSGEVIFKDKYLFKEAAAIREALVFFDGRCFFYDRLNAKDVCQINRGLYHQWDTELFYDYLGQFRVPVNIEIKSMSLGTKNKLLLAAMMARKPDILILDELTSGLDIAARDIIKRMLKAYVDNRGAGLIFSTHIMDDLEEFANRILLIDNGELVLNEAMADFKRQCRGESIENVIKDRLGLQYGVREL